MFLSKHKTHEINASFVEEPRPLVHILREGRTLIAPALADRILKEAAYVGQRKTYPHHVALLADSMRRGDWTAGSQIAFALFNGHLHLVNGKHRMHAVVESGKTVEFQVLIEESENDEELKELYYHFDVAQRARSITEVLNAADIANSHGLSKAMTRALYDAVAYFTNGLERPHYQVDPVKARSIDMRLAAARVWWPFGKILESHLAVAPSGIRRRLLNPGVAAVGLSTTRYQPAKAESFWRGIAENDGLRRGDPRHTFLLDLQTRDFKATPGLLAASLAWNAWFEERSLKVIKVYDNTVARILGTPFDGTRK